MFNDNRIISLEPTFNHNGGLIQYEIYGASNSDISVYKYRNLTAKEIITLPVNNLSHNDTRLINIIKLYGFDIKKIVSTELNKIRKEKIVKLRKLR